MRWPGAIREPDRDVTPVLTEALGLLRETIGDLNDARAREGARLRDLLRQRCELLKQQVANVRSRLPEVSARLRAGMEVWDSCPRLIREADEYQYAGGRAGRRETPLDEHNHAMDALRYLVCGMDWGRPRVEAADLAKARTPDPADEQRRAAEKEAQRLETERERQLAAERAWGEDSDIWT